MKPCPPVVLLIFNRPDCTRRVLEVVRKARPPRLFVVADGPRNGRADDAINCEAARATIEQHVDWTCEVRRELAATNLGCARRVSSGLDWVFSQVDEAIVLEDDCLPDERFFSFCRELLERFRDEPRVGAIGGSNFQKEDVTGGNGFYFSRYPHVWGWATWRRAWSAYDHAMSEWPAAKREGWAKAYFGSAREANFWEGVLDRVYAGEIDSWAYRWAFTFWRRDWLAALPASRLVTNIGFDASATHTRKVPAGMGGKARPQPWPLAETTSVERHAVADRYTFEHHFHLTLSARVRRKLGQLLGAQ